MLPGRTPCAPHSQLRPARVRLVGGGGGGGRLALQVVYTTDGGLDGPPARQPAGAAESVRSTPKPQINTPALVFCMSWRNLKLSSGEGGQIELELSGYLSPQKLNLLEMPSWATR